MEILLLLLLILVPIAIIIIINRGNKNPDVPLPNADLDESIEEASAMRDLSDDDMKIAPARSGDEDVKIATKSFGDEKSNHDYADIAANEFLKQREAGNIEIASNFGELLAKQLWQSAQELIMKPEDELNSLEAHQIILLESYAINVFIGDYIPNGLLAELVVSVFYQHTEELSDVLFKHLRDMPGYSLYILNHRSSSHEEEVGRIYAKLNNKEGDQEEISKGNRIYHDYYAKCKELMDEQVKFNV